MGDTSSSSQIGSSQLLGIPRSMVLAILLIGWSSSPCRGRPTFSRSALESTRRQASWPQQQRATKLWASLWNATSEAKVVAGSTLALPPCDRLSDWIPTWVIYPCRAYGDVVLFDIVIRIRWL